MANWSTGQKGADMTGWSAEKKDALVAGMDQQLEGFDLDEVRAEGMTVRIGGKVVKLEVSSETSLPEDDIREEYRALLNTRLGQIKEILNEKVSELSYMVDQSKADFEEREGELQRRLSEANLMPEITIQHAQQGLSVVKGSRSHSGESDVLTWLFQGVYWPKYYDGKPIDPKYAKRLVTPVTLEIITVGQSVRSINVRKSIGLGKFAHYHGHSDSDCWGRWSHPTSWNTPDDIIAVGRRAMAVLENINPMSPANTSPSGLPRIETVQSHTISEGDAREHRTSRTDERTGISTNDRGESETVWSAD